jgi:hypothetical protein
VREDGRQDVMITTFPDAQKGLQMLEESFDKIMASLEEYFQALRLEASRLTDDEKASLILTLIRMIQYEDWILSITGGIKLIKITEMQYKLDNFRHKVYHFIIECSPKKDPLKILNMISQSYLMESKMIFDFDSLKLAKSKNAKTR